MYLIFEDENLIHTYCGTLLLINCILICMYLKRVNCNKKNLLNVQSNMFCLIIQGVYASMMIIINVLISKSIYPLGTLLMKKSILSLIDFRTLPILLVSNNSELI